MESRKASQDGVNKIKNSVNAISKREGRGKQSHLWLIEATKKMNPDWNWNQNSNYPSGISLTTWKWFRSGAKSINAGAFNAYCVVLGLDPNEIAEYPPNSYGFIRPPEARSVFNDYSGDRVVDELWADPLSKKHGGTADSYIKANVETAEPGSKDEVSVFLNIKFVRQGWGANITIRSMNDTPVNASKFQFLHFKIRSPNQDFVGIRVRLTDANNVSWGYGRSDLAYDKSKKFSTSSDAWSQSIQLPLDVQNWFHFRYDGYPISIGQRPNFEAIHLVTLEVGFEPKSEEPTCGLTGFSMTTAREGEIHISPIGFN
ncbi:hypothetical protein [Nostoc sp. ChiSLP03a]|uniref:hypothetical protein n=1 Tax=Nostoc sp. ChiSLP03a TaxID=3075380 RepID=UPI002AD1DD85|nr:hypothetical protein [Nostoc sp. ChiSLP03a]MDZ8214516.1 hypothetical protein [Nostoc sp. ChiSLP03a]